MKRFLLICLVFYASQLVAQKTSVAHKIRSVQPSGVYSFDQDWSFTRDSVSATDLNNKNPRWRKINLPHDWSVEDLPNQIPDSVIGPFSKASIGTTATGYTLGGTGWYKKNFDLNAPGKKAEIHFDGIYMVSDVWLNGHHLGTNYYGYSPFYYDLTPWLKPSGNELLVRVQNTGRNSRWYSGSGIYRHVWLRVEDPTHIATWGVFVTTPEVSADKAKVRLVTTIESGNKKAGNAALFTKIVAPDGSSAGSTQNKFNLSSSRKEIRQSVSVAQPMLWSAEAPRLYQAITYIKTNTGEVDSIVTSFGIRSIQIDAKNGLLVNGHPTELKGGCIHHDNGPLGSATFDRAEERKIEILKSNGFNAIRTSHNPPSTALLEACDRLGMYVIDEAFDMWERPKNPQDYHIYFDQHWKRDLRSMILRDRNHPSVILWSIGNEINERADSSGLVIAKNLIKEVRSLDTTRLITEAICSFWDHPGRTWEATAPAFALLGVGGYNYQWRQYEPDHTKYPERIMAGTESIPKEAFENWQQVEKHSYVIGDFVWTAFDYMGETGIGHAILNNRKDSFAMTWPWYNAWCGDIDITGNKKPQSFYRDVVWDRSPVEMAVHRPLPDTMKEIVSYWGWPDELQSWTWNVPESKPMQVRVFSKAKHIQLLLNDQVVGEQDVPDSSITAVFTVPYQPGTLKAVASDNGSVKGTATLQTAGAPARIQLRPDRSSISSEPGDLSYVTVEVVDQQGNVVPEASVPIQFTINGEGELAATGNADPTDMASFSKPERKTFRGRCLVILKSNGKRGTITLKAKANNLESAETKITTEAVQAPTLKP